VAARTEPPEAAREQEEVAAALADPGFYPHRPERVEHVQTHISHVFLAGPYVYKLKKAVRFSFLDFGTAERRRFFCAEEVRLNRRLALDVYLGVLRVTRESDGRLALEGGGAAVAHLVWMRRLPADRRLVSLVEHGALDAGVLDRLARLLAAFHAGAPTGLDVAGHADPEVLRARCDDTVGGLEPFVGGALAPEEHAILLDFGPSFVRRHEVLLRARQTGGHVREGHGDLHAEHVYDLDVPVPAIGDLPPLAAGLYLVDCIEFSPSLRCNDVASEVAFLAMDLARLERPDLAARLVAAYAAAAGDPGVHLLVPFYAYHRACVRGLVNLLASAEAEIDAAERAAAVARARRYVRLALRYAWSAGEPAAIAMSGLSGTGKSALAAALADATGFEVVSTDALRKEGGRAAAAGGAGRPAGADRYTPAARAAVYERLCAVVESRLAAGRSVIADATFLRRAHRDRLQRVGRAARRHVVFLECRADEDAVRRRLMSRDDTALSDARWDTYVGQRSEREPAGADEPVLVVDTSGDLAAARAAALRVLWRWHQGRPAGS